MANALPAGQGFDLVPEGMRRDLPVPSQAVPAGEGPREIATVRAETPAGSAPFAPTLGGAAEGVGVMPGKAVGTRQVETAPVRFAAFPVIDEKGTRHIADISSKTAQDINALGFSTKESRVVIEPSSIEYIEGRHGKQLSDDDVALIRDAINDPTEVLPNIGTPDAPHRSKSVLFVRQNGKDFVAVVEVAPDENDNPVWNFWKMSKKRAQNYLAKNRDEKTRRLQPGWTTPTTIESGGASPAVSPEGLSGAQAENAGEENIATLTPEVNAPAAQDAPQTPARQDAAPEAEEAGQPRYSRRVRGGIAPDAFDFIAAPQGGQAFGVISPETARKMGEQPGEIRLQKGTHDVVTDRGFGERHIWARHGDELSRAGYNSASEFVSDVLNNWQEIHIAGTRADNGVTKQKYAAVIHGPNARNVLVEFRKERGGFYTIVSAYTLKEAKAKRRFNQSTFLARRGTPAMPTGPGIPPKFRRLRDLPERAPESPLGVRSALEEEDNTSPPAVNEKTGLTRAKAKPILDALGIKAHGVVVVQSVTELPAELYAKMKRDNALDAPGVYWYATPYVILDNNQDAAQLIRSVLHETQHDGMVDYALSLAKSMSDADIDKASGEVRRAVLNIYAAHRGAIQKNALARGPKEGKAEFDLTTEQGRANATEEWLADQPGTMDTRLGTRLGTRLLDAIRKFVRAVAKKLGVMLKRDIKMDWTLADTRNFVREVMASRVERIAGEQVQFIKPGAVAGNPAYMRQSEASEWARQLDDFAAGRGDTGKPLTVGTTPKVMRMLGARELPLTMTRRKVALVTKGDHHIPLETMKDLPRALSDPYMIFNSTSEADSLTVLTDLMENGNPVLVAIHLNTKDGHLDVNRVASAYGKENLSGFLRKQELERTFRYVNKRKTSEGQKSGGLQLPKELTFRGKGKILTEKDLGNHFDEEILGQGQNPSYSRRVRSAEPDAPTPKITDPNAIPDPAAPGATRTIREWVSDTTDALMSSARDLGPDLTSTMLMPTTIPGDCDRPAFRPGRGKVLARRQGFLRQRGRGMSRVMSTG